MMRMLKILEMFWLLVTILAILGTLYSIFTLGLAESKYYIFGKDGGKELAAKLDVPLLGQIPIVQGICEGGDQGKPVVLDSKAPVAAAFDELAKNVIRETERRNIELPPTKVVEITKK